MEAPCLKGLGSETKATELAGRLSCPAEGGAEALACALQEALLARDSNTVAALMSDTVLIGLWASEGYAQPADQAAVELVEQRLPAETGALTFTTDREAFPPLAGIAPETMFGPDAEPALIVYSEGWGSDGRGATLLFIHESPEGSYSLNGIVLSAMHFDK
jgi:hypothetical protein